MQYTVDNMFYYFHTTLQLFCPISMLLPHEMSRHFLREIEYTSKNWQKITFLKI